MVTTSGVYDSKIGRLDRLLLCLVVLAAISCGGSGEPARDRSGAAVDPGPANESPKTAPTAPRVVVMGDSLTAGLGIPRDQAYPALLQQKLTAKGYAVEVINAGVSG